MATIEYELQSLASTEAAEVVVNINETLLSSIQERLKDIPQPCTIFRVREDIREEDPRAYSPRLVAIGPYHRNKSSVLPMERFKSKFLADLIARHPSNGLEKYITALSCPSFLSKASKCYSEPVDISDGGHSFIEMLMFDGCFIIELLLKSNERESLEELLDLSDIKRDHLLLENQIPFFVLQALFNSTIIKPTIIKPGDYKSGPSTLKGLAFSFLWCHGKGFLECFHSIPAVVHHLLHLAHSIFIWAPKKQGQLLNSLRPTTIPSATELHNSGIKFKKKKTDFIVDITFKKGVMEMPFQNVNQYEMTNLRNLMAFELSYPAAGNCIISYIDFMDSLIDTASDVALLDRSGVIVRDLGGHEEVARFFNSIGKAAGLDYNVHYLKEVLQDVNKYCSHKKHRWWASMMNDYFYSPWSTVSVIAAVILLLLTFVQTFFAVLAYFRPP